ncbi:unnamed protein product, partial [Rotaria sp. Silwood2]
AVCTRFRIYHDRFDGFFRTCLRRTLAQMLRDVRREQRRAVYDAAAGDTSVRSGAGDLNGEEVAGDYDNGIQEVIFVIKSVGKWY